MSSDEDAAHDSLVAEIRKINSVDRKKSKRAQVKNVRVTRESEIPSYKLGNILSKLGGGQKVKKKLQPLVEPLDKPKAKRIHREAGYERVAVDANKWHGIVQERKKADQLHFPLEEVDLRVITSERNYKPSMKTDLEKEVYKLLQGANLETQEKEETEEEKAIKKAMSLKEIRERSRKIMMDRNLKMRLERKAARLNKSKSRKYHRILRRERLKSKKQEFERLKATNPEEALKVLKEIERTRVKERMDLRHRKSKWLRLQQTRAPHDDQVRDMLKENTEMRLELLEKLKLEQESDSEDGSESDSDDQANGNGEGETQDISEGISSTKSDMSFYKMKHYWESIHEQKLREANALKVVEEFENQQKKKEGEENEEEDSEEEQEGEDKELEEEDEDQLDEEYLEGEELEEEEEEQLNEKEETFKRTVNKGITVEVKDKEDGNKICGEKQSNVKKESVNKSKNKQKISNDKKKSNRNKQNNSEEDKTKQLKRKTENNEEENKKMKKADKESKVNRGIKNEENKTKQLKRKTENNEEENKKMRKAEKESNVNEGKKNTETKKKTQTMNKEIEIQSRKTVKETERKEKEIKNEKPNAKETKPTEKKENQNSVNFEMKVVDRILGTAKHDRGFINRKINNDESDSEDEGFEDIIGSDDYVKQFAEDKKAHEEEMKPKDIDNFKAGWGNWGGPGIVHQEKRKRKFRIKAPKPLANKYSKIGNVIYNEKGDMHENLRKNMVNELPFPFTTVKDFEASIRQPIGRTFVPELSHKKLIAPSVVQKMGTVIQPMDEECLIKQHEEYKKVESALEKELDEELNRFRGNRKRETVSNADENKRRKTNKKKKKNKRMAKPLILF